MKEVVPVQVVNPRGDVASILQRVTVGDYLRANASQAKPESVGKLTLHHRGATTRCGRHEAGWTICTEVENVKTFRIYYFSYQAQPGPRNHF